MKIKYLKHLVFIILAGIVFPANDFAQGIVISSSANLVMNGTSTLYINNAGFTNNGSFVKNNGTVTLTGSGTATIGGTATTDFNNLTLGGSTAFTMGANASVSGTLTVSGTATLDPDGALDNKVFTLKSSSTGTARVATNTNPDPYIVGDVVVERYTSDKRAWRLLTAPVVSTQTIKDAWMENKVNNNGFGTHITTFTGDTRAAGFDAEKPASSIRAYVGNSWASTLANTPDVATVGIDDQPGYFLFVRGDRTMTLTGTTEHSAAYLRSTGTLKQGTQTAVSVPYSASDYTLVGNPFASPVDYEYLLDHTTNLSPSFYIWNSNLAGSYGVGGFLLMTSKGAGVYESTPPAGTVDETNARRYIHSGSAFMVNATENNTASLVFNEDCKSDLSASSIIPYGTETVDEEMTMNLSIVNVDNSINLVDGFRAKYNNGYFAAVTAEDIRKMANFNENLGLLREAENLIIEKRPVMGATDTLYLKTTNLGIKNYRFDINAIQLDHPDLVGKLVDNFLNTETPINLAGPTVINFSVTADAASYAENRFKVVFYTLFPLPVSFTNIKASQQNKDIAVEWMVANQLNMQKYDVEKSTDGRNFTKVATKMATGINGTSATYNWLDVQAVSGNNYYRVRGIGIAGDSKYSRIVKVTMGMANAGIVVFPNPVVNRHMALLFTDMAKGIYQIKLVNNLGQTLMTGLINHSGGSATQSLAIDKGITKGYYHVYIIKPDSEKTVQKIIITE